MNSRHAVPFVTPGVRVLMVLAAAGLVAVAVRFIWGIGAVTNLDDQYPWGLWIGVDVATGVALAAGGFTTAFVAHVLHRHQYEVIVRPALLTAMLGYTFVALSVCVDLGRYYNIWHFFVPGMSNGNSPLFEVGMCVCLYLTVLYIEFLPVVCERFRGRVNLPGVLGRLDGFTENLLSVVDRTMSRFISVFIVLGIVLSCAHQSSLGTVMVIAQSKLHSLWYSTVLPLQFILSAFAVGLAMAIFESFVTARSLRRPYEMAVLAPLSRLLPFLLTIYFAAKAIDMANRGSFTHLGEFSLQSVSWLVEVGVGVVLPASLLMIHRLRRSPGWLFAASAMVVGGVVLNRLNVYIIGYKAPYADGHYVPAVPEALITVGFVSLLILLYRAFVFIFPVLHEEGETHHA